MQCLIKSPKSHMWEEHFHSYFTDEETKRERSINLSEIVFLVNWWTTAVIHVALTQKAVLFIIKPYLLSKELGVYEGQH